MKLINFKFRVVLSLLLVFFCSSLWGRTSTYKIVNNKGEVVFHVRGTSAKPALPDRAQSPFATNWRYYQYLEDAQLDASSGAAAAATKKLDASMNLSYDGDVFVRYDYNPEANVKDQDGKILRIDGTAAYNFTICDYTGTPNGRYVWYNESSTVHNTTTASSLPSGAEYNEKILVKPYNEETGSYSVTGTVSDEESMEDKITVTLIATGMPEEKVNVKKESRKEVKIEDKTKEIFEKSQKAKEEMQV